MLGSVGMVVVVEVDVEVDVANSLAVDDIVVVCVCLCVGVCPAVLEESTPLPSHRQDGEDTEYLN